MNELNAFNELNKLHQLQETTERIPVRNLWLLMLYAAQLLPLLPAQTSAIEHNPEDIPDLVARLLANLTLKRLQSPFMQHYQSQHAVQARLRGRIDWLSTERQQLRQRGQLACRFQSLQINTPLYAYVRTALQTAAKQVTSPALGEQCQHLAQQLERRAVPANSLSNAELRTLHFMPQQRDDQLLLHVAQLVFELALPTEDSGTHPLPQPERDLSAIRYLYEKAVAGFYRLHLSQYGWQVKTQTRLHWPISAASAGLKAILPSMQADVILEQPHAQRRIVIDTKFTQILKRGRWREGLSSRHIYQLYAYLQSQTGQQQALAETASGLLLYPSYGEMVDEALLLQGHVLRFATLDLMADARAIRQQLLQLVEPLQ